jgi:uncharacterized membrane protein YkoI
MLGGSPGVVRSTTDRKDDHMSDRIKNILLGVSLVAALALGGSAVAGAVSSNNANSNSNAASTTPRQDPGRGDRRHGNETELTGTTAASVEKAAMAKVPGGTIERVETDAEGHAAYEAHMTKADGSEITVYVDKQFNVVSVEEGR